MYASVAENMSCLLPQFKCLPDSFSIQFKSHNIRKFTSIHSLQLITFVNNFYFFSFIIDFFFCIEFGLFSVLILTL